METKKLLITFTVIFVIVFALLSFSLSSGFKGLIGSTISPELIGVNVYVPVIGEVQCVEGQFGAIPTKVGYPTTTNEKILSALTPIQYTFDSYSGGVAKAFVDVKCNGAGMGSCEINLGATPQIHVSCPQGGIGLWKLSRSANQIGYNKITANGGALTSTNINYSDRQLFNENETVTFEAICVNTRPVYGLFFQYYAYTPSYINFNYNQKEKLLRAYSAFGGQFTDRTTLGCNSQAVNKLIYNGSFNPVDGTTTFINPSGQTETVSLTNLPQNLNLNETFTYFEGWKPLDGINLIKDSTGKTYYVNRTTNDVYSVTKEKTVSGTEYLVASNLLIDNAECTGNEDCVQRGSGYQCDPEKGFTCQKDIQIECTYSSECGRSQYITEGQNYFWVSWSCQNNKCVEKRDQLTCNPNKSYPNNGCPSDKTICNMEGTQCFAEVIGKGNCLGACCLESALYYKLDCPTDKVCKTEGSLVGICVDKPNTCNDSKGNGICENGTNSTLNCGETNENTTDCKREPGLEEACALKSKKNTNPFIEGYNLFTKDSPVLLFGFLPNPFGGTISETTCGPIWNWALIFIIIALIIASFSVLIIFMKTKKRKGKRR